MGDRRFPAKEEGLEAKFKPSRTARYCGTLYTTRPEDYQHAQPSLGGPAHTEQQSSAGASLSFGVALGHPGQVGTERGLRTLELPWVAQVSGLLEVLVVVPLHLPLGPTEVVRIVGVPGGGEVILGQAMLTRAGVRDWGRPANLASGQDLDGFALRCVVGRGVGAGAGINGQGPGEGWRAPVLRQLPYLRHERELLRALDGPGDALLLLQLHARQLARQDGTVVAHLGQMDSSVTHSDGGPGSSSYGVQRKRSGGKGKGKPE